MKPSFNSLLQDLMQNEKFQHSMIQQLADFGDRLVRDLQGVPDGGIGEHSLEDFDFWSEDIGLESKSHCCSRLLESISDAVIRIDRSGTIRGANAAAETLIGKPRKQLNGKSFLDLVLPADRNRLFDLWSESLRDHQQVFHIKLQTGTGTNLTVTARAVPIVKGSDFEGSLLIIKGQTPLNRKGRNRKAAPTKENDRTEHSELLPSDISSERIRRLLHEIKEIFYIASANRDIIYVNPEVENVLGYAPDEFLAMNIESKFTDIEDRKRFSKLLELHGWVKDFRFCFVHKNGQICHLSETASAMVDKNEHITGYYGIMRDRTAEHQIEKALRDSEENYRFLVEQFPYALILLDNKGYILQSNRRGTQFLNAENLQTLMGRSVFEVCPPDNANLIREAFASVTLGQSISSNWQWTDSTGNLHWWTMTFSPICHNSVVEKVIWICKDIDREKRIEDQFLLSQKMETVATLIGGLAHDFNNQLGVILGNASFIKDQLNPESEYYEELDAIESTALKARIMINQLMMFTPHRHYQFEPTSVNELVNNMVDFITHSFPKNITITKDIQANPDITVGDPNNLYQALLNVCVNARDAMPGGGHITVTTKNVIQDSAVFDQSSDRFIQIAVSDNGEGMDEETCRRICEPFFTTKRDLGGSGLGMSVAYSIIQHHAGILYVDSKRGRGTSVEISLPQADHSTEPEDTIDGDFLRNRTGGEPETILIVDDEPQVRAMILRIFEKEGFKVHLAENGVEALDVLERHSDDIDLIILDLTMPQMSGKETLTRLRKLYPDVPVLLSSGYTLNRDIQELTKQPHTYFIHKPYRRSAILETVRQILAKSVRFSSE